jgi:rare lipoprotein A
MELRKLLKNTTYTFVMVAVFACKRADSGTETQVQKPEPYTQEGEASYYARSLRGSQMANGAPYKPADMTAAHRKLPLGTKVEVTNTKNDSVAVVEITDRGPYVGDRIIDLSRAAAQELNFIQDGKTNVSLEVVKPADGYSVSDSVGKKP